MRAATPQLFAVTDIMSRCIPDDEPVDLINVAFAPQGSSTYATPDRLSGIEAWNELKNACPRDWRLVTIDVPFEVRSHHSCLFSSDNHRNVSHIDRQC